jgi:hypothetical protein
MKVKKYNGGGYMEDSQMIMAMAPSLEEAVAQVKAAVKAGKMTPTHYKVKACFYEEDED